VAVIKFRPNGYMEVIDNDGREIVLHTDDMLSLARDILDRIQDIHWLRGKLNDMFGEG